MIMKSRLGFVLLCFAAILATSCSTTSGPDKSDWENQVQKILSQNQGQFQTCGKYLKRTGKTPIEVNMTFRLNPSGAVETLWLDESSAWDSRFYDCLFNVVDRMNMPAFTEEVTLEVQQTLLFRSRI